MPGIAGPPTVPPFGPVEPDENTSARKRPRPRFDARDRWTLLAGILFGIAALVVLELWRLVNPAVCLAGLAAFATAAALWRWLMLPPQVATVARGAILGAAIGLLAAFVSWLFSAAFWVVSDLTPLEALRWIFAMASVTLEPVAGVSMLIGALLGAVLGAAEQYAHANPPR